LVAALYVLCYFVITFFNTNFAFVYRYRPFFTTSVFLCSFRWWNCVTCENHRWCCEIN